MCLNRHTDRKRKYLKIEWNFFHVIDIAKYNNKKKKWNLWVNLILDSILIVYFNLQQLQNKSMIFFIYRYFYWKGISLAFLIARHLFIQKKKFTNYFTSCLLGCPMKKKLHIKPIINLNTEIILSKCLLRLEANLSRQLN